MFPESLTVRIGPFIDDAFKAFRDAVGPAFDAAALVPLRILVWIEWVLRDALPWWAVMALAGLAAWALSRRPWLGAATAAGLFLIGVVGLWDNAMQTLAIMIVAIAVCVAIGVPIGIAMAESRGFRAGMLLVLDVMQTLPVFVYLIPVIMLLGIGKVPAILATVIYAVVPMVRLTDLGLRQVDAETVEAAEAFGASRWQLLTKVRFPLALPTILQGLNQTIMMALSMVVIASMIGARGLGEQVLLGIQRLDIGQGLVAGLAIVTLAVLLDRIGQAAGARLRRMPAAER
ncbi:MAG: ABC transporter permease subunit [Rhodospirillaceae bacterium]|nr:ABC transporter permease subunit [Rhodospirillaceae bacterium]